MKKSISMLLILVMVLAFAGCSDSGGSSPSPQESAPPAASSSQSAAESSAAASSPDTTTAPVAAGGAFDSYPRPRVVSSEEITIGYLYPELSTEAQVRSRNQAQIEVEHRGWDYIEINYETPENARDSFQNLINQNPDVIIVGVTQTMEALQDLVALARNQGIGVYSNDNQIVDGIISNCTLSNAAAACELLYKIAEDHSWTLNIVMQTRDSGQVMFARTAPVQGILERGVFPNLKLLEMQDTKSIEGSHSAVAFQIAQTWLQKYGEEIDLIFTAADTGGMSATEAVIQWGDTDGSRVFVCGVNGGNQAWTYIRNNSPLKYTYSQPFEAFTHNVFEIVEDIQVEGLNPGDPGCILEMAGQTLYVNGIITTRSNVPAIGDNVHVVFNYYGGDPADPDAWYNWTDGPGPYIVSEQLS